MFDPCNCCCMRWNCVALFRTRCKSKVGFDAVLIACVENCMLSVRSASGLRHRRVSSFSISRIHSLCRSSPAWGDINHDKALKQRHMTFIDFTVAKMDDFPKCLLQFDNLRTTIMRTKDLERQHVCDNCL